mgnify:CR=1 FL=1
MTFILLNMKLEAINFIGTNGLLGSIEKYTIGLIGGHGDGGPPARTSYGQIFDADNDGDQDIYIASGGNEFEEGSEVYEDRFYENKGNLVFERSKTAIPTTPISGLEVSVNDFDKDGDLDLFVGGRLSPKKYPYPASSRILENK